ncbi:MAG: zinc ribbon domain-containing protein [Acidobacteriota bacterium]
MKCPECQTELHNAIECPNCGAFTDAKPVKRVSPVMVIIAAATIFICVGMVLLAQMGGRREFTDEEKQRIIERNKTPTPTPAPSVRLDHLADFRRRIEAADGAGLIDDMKLDDNNSDKLVITMKADWHYENKAIRKEAATMMWKLWAAIHSPGTPDIARLSLRDRAGNEVGGSRVLGGSLIWVGD